MLTSEEEDALRKTKNILSANQSKDPPPQKLSPRVPSTGPPHPLSLNVWLDASQPKEEARRWEREITHGGARRAPRLGVNHQKKIVLPMHTIVSKFAAVTLARKRLNCCANHSFASAACAEECRFHHVCIQDLKIPNIPKQAKQTMWPQNGLQEQVRGGTIRTAVCTVANKHFHASLNPVKVKRVSALMRYSISTLCMRSL